MLTFRIVLRESTSRLKAKWLVFASVGVYSLVSLLILFFQVVGLLRIVLGCFLERGFFIMWI